MALESEAPDMDPTLSVSVSFISSKKGWIKQQRNSAFG